METHTCSISSNITAMVGAVGLKTSSPLLQQKEVIQRAVQNNFEKSLGHIGNR